MSTILRISLIVCLQLIYFAVSAQEDIKEKILFVGNSYTYFWNLPQTVEALCDEKFDIHQSLAGGANLGQHWRGEKNLNSFDKITSGNYNSVVLQDHSLRAIDHLDSLLSFGKLFGNLIHENKGQVYLYMTWAREWDPSMQEKITSGYKKLAKEINARVVPVGLAWQKARSLRPGFELYDDDKSHPSPLGTYLTACVFYTVFMEQSPVGLPHRVISTDTNGDPLYLNIQSKEDALFCQRVAFDIVNENY